MHSTLDPVPLDPGPGLDLRRELADAIANRDAAERALAAALVAAGRAASAKDEGAANVERLKTGLDTIQHEAIRAHAVALTLALRNGVSLPPTPGDTAALSLALARLGALHQAAVNLETEAAKAAEAFAATTAQVDGLIDDILDAEAEALADAVIQSIELHWRLLERLSGLCKADEARRDGPHLTKLQERVKLQIDRPRREMARDPQLVEAWRFNEFCDGLVAAEESRWRSFANRLRHDAAARFEEGPTQ